MFYHQSTYSSFARFLVMKQLFSLERIVFYSTDRCINGFECEHMRECFGEESSERILVVQMVPQAACCVWPPCSNLQAMREPLLLIDTQRPSWGGYMRCLMEMLETCTLGWSGGPYPVTSAFTSGTPGPVLMQENPVPVSPCGSFFLLS